ncbi:asparagine synthase-related protein [Halomonas ventosae]|uniref:Asparagine synthase n=1 Tax=Halomonas ventosae TaxID=229007 RepID=A0A2T0VKX6_9GAMM|nr:asparagine synthase-related protein [Halomonas ventosae]PRY70909.1 asparagine synthase [Halomonas ventosae]
MNGSDRQCLPKKSTCPHNSYLVVAGAGPHAPDAELGSLFAHTLALRDVKILHNLDDCYTASAPGAGADIVALGHLYNPFTGRVGREALLDLAAHWHEGLDALLDAASELSGRFVLLVLEHGKGLRIIPDACATLPIAYALERNQLLLSSHACFIRAVLSLPDDPLVKRLLASRFYHFGIRHCPADLTEVDRVKLLTPNISLSHDAGRLLLQRFYPTCRRVELPVDEVVAAVAAALRNAIDCLVRYERPLACALSGGVDSRVSLAATVGHRDRISFFTFSGDRKRNRDADCTRDLARRLSLIFEDVELSPPIPDDRFREEYRTLQGNTRRLNANTVLFRKQHFGDARGFEIRSCISEISRSFMRRKFHIRDLPISAHAMVPLYKRVPFMWSWHRRIFRAFDEWCRRVDFEAVERHGYDWLDFYYWELRVGTWQSQVLQDSDYYATPTVIFNNRKLLDMMLSVPEAYRMSDELQLMVIDRMDPSVMQLPMVKNFGKKAAIREFIESSYLKAYMPIFG